MLVNNSHHLMVVWFKPKDNIYYAKLIRGYSSKYYVGKENQYGHIIVLVIELEYYTHKLPLRKKLLKKLISFLENIERRT